MKYSSFFGLLAATSVPVMAINSSTYVYSQNGANITVSLTAAADTKDLFFRLSMPTAYDWMSVAIGSELKGAFSLITYPAKDGQSLTLSPRTSTTNGEPTYNKNIDCKIVGDSNPNLGDQVVFSVICRNAAKWSNPPLDLTSTKAPFMWSIGRPMYKNGSLWSNSPNADLRRYSALAKFTMDMVQATVPSNSNDTLPSLGNSTTGASDHSNITTEHDYMSPGHAIACFVALLILMPLESVLRLFIKTVKFHVFMIALVSIVFFVGIGLGFAVSGQFNRSKDYNSAHQVVGLLIFIIFLAQFAIGYFAHKKDKTVQQPRRAESDMDPLTTVLTPKKRSVLTITHIVLGSVMLIMAIVDGALGFNLALTSAYNMKYAIVVVAIFLVWLGVSGLRWMWNRTKKDDFDEEEHERNTKAAIETYQMQAWQNQQQQHQQHYGTEQPPPPSYGAQGQFPSVSIPRSY